MSGRKFDGISHEPSSQGRARAGKTFFQLRHQHKLSYVSKNVQSSHAKCMPFSKHRSRDATEGRAGRSQMRLEKEACVAEGGPIRSHQRPATDTET